LGYAVLNYTPPPAGESAYYVDAPLGVGVAYQAADIFQLSMDVAYRVAVTGAGEAYQVSGPPILGSDNWRRITPPTSGWSLMLGASFAL